MSKSELQQTYKNADARPHRGDVVKFQEGSETRRGRVRKSRKSAGVPRTYQVHIIFANFRRAVARDVSDVKLVDATTPRFDGYDPDD
jgi:hypothetical protein